MDFYLQLLWEVLNYFHPGGAQQGGSRANETRRTGKYRDLFGVIGFENGNVGNKIPLSAEDPQFVLRRAALTLRPDDGILYRHKRWADYSLRREGVQFLERHRAQMRGIAQPVLVVNRPVVQAILTSPEVSQSPDVVVLAVSKSLWDDLATAEATVLSGDNVVVPKPPKALTTAENALAGSKEQLIQLVEEGEVEITTLMYPRGIVLSGVQSWIENIPGLTVTLLTGTQKGHVKGEGAALETAAKFLESISGFEKAREQFWLDLPAFLAKGSDNLRAFVQALRNESEGIQAAKASDIDLSAVREHATILREVDDVYHVQWPAAVLDQLYSQYV